MFVIFSIQSRAIVCYMSEYRFSNWTSHYKITVPAKSRTIVDSSYTENGIRCHNVALLWPNIVTPELIISTYVYASCKCVRDPADLSSSTRGNGWSLYMYYLYPPELRNLPVSSTLTRGGLWRSYLINLHPTWMWDEEGLISSVIYIHQCWWTLMYRLHPPGVGDMWRSYLCVLHPPGLRDEGPTFVIYTVRSALQVYPSVYLSENYISCESSLTGRRLCTRPTTVSSLHGRAHVSHAANRCHAWLLRSWLFTSRFMIDLIALI